MAHSEHLIVQVRDLWFGQQRFPRASCVMGCLFAEHFWSVHRSRARVLSAGSFRRRALYNPNFKGSAWCAVPPPSIPLMSPKTDAIVLSDFSFAPRCSHPIAMISECLLFEIRMRRGTFRVRFNTHWAAKLEKVSATMFSSASFASISWNARRPRSNLYSLSSHWSYPQGSVCNGDARCGCGVNLPFS